MSRLSKMGILAKGGAAISQLQDLRVISFDKTGTLTKGTPELTDYWFEDETIIPAVVAMENNRHTHWRKQLFKDSATGHFLKKKSKWKCL